MLAAVLFVGAAAPAFAQKYSNVGRAKCVNCHDHDREKLWSEKKDGPPPNNHVNALKQMDTPKSKDFAKAVGVADVYDPASSSCLKCHATVVKGDVGGGITCESCHGPGSGYLDPHQKKDAYAAAVATGMTDAVKKPQAWAALCMNCHVMDDARLIAAKHPSGDDFDLGAKFQVVATDHWKNSYDKAQIAALGKAELQKIVAKRKGGAVTTAAAAPAAAAAPPAAAAAPPAAPPPPAPPAPPAAPPATATGTPAAATPAPPPAAVPAVPPPAASAPATRTPAAAAPAAPPTARPSPAPARPAPAAARSAPAAAAVPAPGLPPPAAAAPPPPPADVSSDMMNAVSSLAAALPTSPAAAVAAVQGRAIALIDALLRRGGRAPVRVTPPEKKADYRGPDADLLRLQDDVLSLAIEALRTAPPPPKPEGKP